MLENAVADIQLNLTQYLKEPAVKVWRESRWKSELDSTARILDRIWQPYRGDESD